VQGTISSSHSMVNDLYKFRSMEDESKSLNFVAPRPLAGTDQ
jgi:hypothetical protein